MRAKLPWIALAAATVTVPAALGTAPLDLVRYAAYILYAVVVPGTLLYRAVRPTPRSLLEDLTYGTVVGLLAETVAFVAASLLDARGLLWVWPLVVAPLARRHLRAPAYPLRPSTGWSWAVAGIAAGFLAYLTAAFLAVNPPVPTAGPHDYMIDQLNLLAVSADLKHHFPLAVPEQGDRALGYHWFAYGHLAAGGLVSGVDLPVLWFRLDLPVLAVLAVCLLAVTGWRVARHPWAGPVAAALMFTVGELVPQRQAPAFFGSITAYYSWSSRSLLFGAALSMPLIAAIASVLRRDDPPGRDRWRGWLLVLLFAAGTTGAKSTIVPLFGAGVAVLCAVHLLRRNPQWTPWRLGALLAAVAAAAVTVIYGFEGQGLRWGPFAIMLDFVGSQRHGTTPRDVPLILWGLGAYAIAMGARLAGVAGLGRHWDDTEIFLAGTTAAGIAGTLCVWHVSWSEHFFIVAAWPCAAILSAAGLVRLPWSPQALRRALAVAALLAGASVLVRVPSPARWGVPLPVYALGALVLAAALLLGLRHGRFAALVVVLAAGAARLPYDAATSANLGVAYHVRVTPDQAAGARWLRAHSTPEQYVATNVHRVGAGLQGAQSLAYWISAYSERRVLLGSWGYSPESTAAQSRAHRLGPALTYWDPARLALNDAAVLDPTPARLDWLWRQRVRWIFVDRAQGAPTAALPALADLAWQRDDIAVYRLRATANCTPVSCSDSVQSR
ncbi:hypothetical protein Daura_03745 [Dactylosporangium aurantiacum]|uniref:Uncharacterized protein n=1 Tax=Dactylosporangium aurantiacum TaxID=35754 RepID=A0A9Q9MI03_9ACTN|nr:hypothetical protein [Dactylosporangium aurantiacum]MDG6100527.1 hypothetical protein [Dactylosporangium aurantiacum]UWZ55375.1 hypothetical protein Daura_03745 [Dactylosporangium aurantiacum]